MSNEVTIKKFKKDSLPSGRVVPELDLSTQKSLEEIDAVQDELDQLNEKLNEEILQVERKYGRIRKPHFEKRNQLIDNVPNFWYTAIVNHPDLTNFCSGEEEGCLHHLSKIRIEESDDISSGYAIKFYFFENPYFENSVLVKEYRMNTDPPTSTSTEIMWKGIHQLRPSNSQISQSTSSGTKKRRLDNVKTSFFAWFNDNVDPYTDDIADLFKDDLWLNPLQYYLVPDAHEEEAVEEEESSSEEEPEDQSG